MAGTSLLALLDDIASLLDDISTMTKVAATKTAGVVGDDLAVNAEQFAGIRAERELPVVWAVAKGSLFNKVILVPAALTISALAPWAIMPILMAGGGYLCFEGFEKIAHKYLAGKDEADSEHGQRLNALADQSVDLLAFEKEKIRGAVRTDLVLSAEIIVITLGTLSGQPFAIQAATVTVVAFALTIGVYAFVAGIIKIDDLGLFIVRSQAKTASKGFVFKLGRFLLAFAPKLMKTIAFVGTAAMFMVGGSIIAHGLPTAATEAVEHTATSLLGPDSSLLTPLALLADIAVGLLVGAILVGIFLLAKPLVWKIRR